MSDFKRRIASLFANASFDFALINSYESLRYFSGFKGLGGAFLILSRDGTSKMFVTELEAPDAKEAVYDQLVVVEKTKKFQEEIEKALKSYGERGQIGLEDSSITLSMYEEIKPYVNSWVGISKKISELRSVKDDEEISLIRKAVKIAEESFLQIRGEIKPGATENHVAAELEKAMKEAGAEGIAFPTIVASGERAANPHAVSTDKRIRDGEVVVVDFGAKYKGYDSDLTRTVFVGDVGDTMRSAFNAVLDTQQTCFKALSLGTKLSDVANLAIKNLAKYKLDRYYTHSLGHGIGLEVHESPYLSTSSQDLLKEGQTFTIEPGVYIEGIGGIRIEDDFISTKQGVTRLSSLSARF